MRVPFGEWLPDRPPLGNPGMTVAKNCVPRLAGYGPYPSLQSAGLGAADDTVLAGYLAEDTSQIPYNFAATQGKLYRYAPTGLSDVSKSGGYRLSGSSSWALEQFGEIVYAANMNDPMQWFNLRTSTAFADVGGGAPRARHLGVIGNFMIAGNVYDAEYGRGRVPNGIWWPAIGNPLSWPQPGTDLAISVQSDIQPLEGNGGEVMAVASGAELGAIFQERKIWRMSYIGGAVIFALDDVEVTRGLLIPGLAIPIGRRIFFCAEDGFYWFNYTTATPVGEERVNRFFLNDIDSELFHRVTWAVDPDRPLLLIAYPGQGHDALGNPNRILVYNYVLDRFSLIEENVEALVRALTFGEHLDSLPTDDLDAFEPTTSFDDPVAGPGAEKLGGYTTTHELGRFDGGYPQATLETGDVELRQGWRSFCGSVRPLVKGADAEVQVAGLARSNRLAEFGSTSVQDEDGKCPVRVDARYHRFRVKIPAGGFEDAVGVDVWSHRTGLR